MVTSDKTKLARAHRDWRVYVAGCVTGLCVGFVALAAGGAGSRQCILSSEGAKEIARPLGSSRHGPFAHPLLDPALTVHQQLAAIRCGDVAALRPALDKNDLFFKGARAELVPDDMQQVRRQGLNRDKRPTFAVCVMGQLRSFSSIMAHETIKRNVIESFGANRTLVYMQVAATAVRGSTFNGKIDVENWPYPDSHIDRITKYVARAKGAEVHVKVLRMSGEDRVRLTASHRNETLCRERHVANFGSARDARPYRRDDSYFSHPNDFTRRQFRSFLAQLQDFEDCWKWVRKKEADLGLKVDFVLKTRPDAVWLRPIEPYCTFREAQRLVRRRDWAFLVARPMIDSFHRMYTNYMSCTTRNDYFVGEGKPFDEWWAARLEQRAAPACPVREWRLAHQNSSVCTELLDSFVLPVVLLRTFGNRATGFCRNARHVVDPTGIDALQYCQQAIEGGVLNVDWRDRIQ